MWSTLDMCAQVFSNTGAKSKAMKWTRTLRKYSYKKKKTVRTNFAIFEYKETTVNSRRGQRSAQGFGVLEGELRRGLEEEGCAGVECCRWVK